MTAASTTDTATWLTSFDREQEQTACHEALRAATYVEFQLGYGEAPGLDLGSPVLFERAGTVYSQRFARGLTLANVGDEPCEVVFDRPYFDLAGALRTSVVLPARSADVLHLEAPPRAASTPSVPEAAVPESSMPGGLSRAS